MYKIAINNPKIIRENVVMCLSSSPKIDQMQKLKRMYKKGKEKEKKKKHKGKTQVLIALSSDGVERWWVVFSVFCSCCSPYICVGARTCQWIR